MKLAANIVGVAMVLAGALWALQGANILAGSAMSGQSMWLWIGVVVLVAGLGVLYWYNMRRRG
ncbi:MAG: hypothetical protein EOP19_29625 [Hyphomicrobiales bacterium]|nr:MAG: hypothetical protein EOP19_29625 [Hyphomicrobiales bacterium]